MNSQILRRIQMDIRNNFGKIVDWDSLPKGNFNCFMFAVSNTIPTEILHHQDEKDGRVFLESLVNEKVPYFSDIGQISGKVQYTNVSELIEALKSDLETLGILAEECSSKEIVSNQCIKIAFYYNTEDLLRGIHSNFHFIRQEGNKWVHKKGWGGNIEQLECPIEEVSIKGLELIGYFRLSLNHNCT